MQVANPLISVKIILYLWNPCIFSQQNQIIEGNSNGTKDLLNSLIVSLFAESRLSYNFGGECHKTERTVLREVG